LRFCRLRASNGRLWLCVFELFEELGEGLQDFVFGGGGENRGHRLLMSGWDQSSHVIKRIHIIGRIPLHSDLRHLTLAGNLATS